MIGGDGTGPEVVAEGIKALRAVGAEFKIAFNFTEFDLGGARYLKTGEILPASVLTELRKFKAIYLGAVGHPDVEEAAAIGVPDANSGEAVKLFVVRKDPALTEAQLRDFLHEQLTGYKRPRYIEFRDDLPKTPVGKILRRELRS